MLMMAITNMTRVTNIDDRLGIVATGGGVKFLSAVYIFFQKTTQFLTCFTSLHTPKYKLSIELLKELHLQKHSFQKRCDFREFHPCFPCPILFRC